VSLDAIPLLDLPGDVPPPRKFFGTDQEKKKPKPGPRALKTTTKTTPAIAEKVRLARKEILDGGGLPEHYIVCETTNDLGAVAHAIATHKAFDFDCETAGLNPWKDSLYCVSIWVGGKSYLINFEHPLLPKIERSLFCRLLGSYFSDPSVRRRGFNIKFDGHFIEEQLGLAFGDIHGDAGTALWLTNEAVMGSRGENKLKPLCNRFLGLKGVSYDEAFGLQAWITIDPLVASYYACKDAELHYQLNNFAEGLLEGTPLKKLYHNLEIPILDLYFETEREGFPVDVTFLPKLDDKLTAEIASLRNSMDALAMSVPGVEAPPNWDSNDELPEFLFKELRLPRIKQNSTDRKVLERLQDKHPIIKLLMRYRKLFKQKTAFVDALAIFIHNGKIHPSFKGIGSDTGRGACSEPNMLQIPARGEGAVIRQLFLPDFDGEFYWVSKDYSGQELGLQAFMSGDETLKNLIREGRDFYSEATAVYYGGVSADYDKHGPNSSKRDKGKQVILAMSYGAQAGKVAEVFGCDYRRGQQFIDDFYRRFAGLKRMQEQFVKQAKKQGYVETILGRRRHLDFNDTMLERFQKLAMERYAVNSPIQGSATDQIKLAGINIRKHFREKGYKSRVLFSIHDEWILKIHKDEMFETFIMQEVDALMKSAIPMDIPVTISTEIYDRWGHVVKFEDDSHATA
jgi:DNA polymerase-1